MKEVKKKKVMDKEVMDDKKKTAGMLQMMAMKNGSGFKMPKK